MSDKKNNINRRTFSDHPEPDVPVEQAWLNMQALLLEHDLTRPVKEKRRRRVLLFLLLFALVCIGVAVWQFSEDKNEGTIQIVMAEKKEKDTGTGKTKQGAVNAEQGTADKKKESKNKAKGIQNNKSDIKKMTEEIKSREEETGNKKQIITTDDQTIWGDKETTKQNDKNRENTPENFIKDSIAFLQQVLNDNGQNTASNSNLLGDASAINKPSALTANKNKKNNTYPRFHFGLEWDASFSVANNTSYFEGYNGNQQYYMWLIPSVWGKMDLNKKSGLLLHIDPYMQQFGGEQALNIEKSWIMSDVPDIVTKLAKTKGFGFGLQYEHSINNKLSFAAGGDFMLLQKVLYKEQLMDTSTGTISSERVYAAAKNEYDFRHMHSTAINWNVSLKYHFKNWNIGAGLTRPVTNLGSNDNFKVRPVNAGIYLQYKLK